MKYLDLATQIALADLNVKDRHFIFGCVALRQDGALITTKNIKTQLPMTQAHAESRALRQAGHGATLYLVRLNRLGQWALAKPCSACAALIKNHQVKKVCYTVAPNIYATWQP